MAVYEYRRLYVTIGHEEQQEPCGCSDSECTRKRTIRVRRLVVADTGAAEKPAFESEWSSEREDVPNELVPYLNRLGRDGWRLSGFYPESERLYEGSGQTASNWPEGNHVLMRERR